VRGTTGDLLGLLRLHEEATHTQRSVVAAALAIANIFFCAYFERYVAGPSWQQALVTLLAIETGFLILITMGVYLQQIDPILRRTRIHPITTASRFSFVVAALMRHRYVVLFWGSGVFAMAVMVHPAASSVPLVVLSFIVPGAAFIVLAITLLVFMERWTSSGAVALAGVGLVACITGSVAIVFPESRALEIFLPLKWCVHSCAAALTGDPVHCLLFLLPFVVLSGVAWLGGQRYA
jgi:hypothetical protein